MDTSGIIAASREQRRCWAERLRQLDSIEAELVARSREALARAGDLLRRTERTIEKERSAGLPQKDDHP
jgi:hypothetical protein